jgi:hypothetical protein
MDNLYRFLKNDRFSKNREFLLKNGDPLDHFRCCDGSTKTLEIRHIAPQFWAPASGCVTVW